MEDSHSDAVDAIAEGRYRFVIAHGRGLLAVLLKEYRGGFEYLATELDDVEPTLLLRLAECP